MKFDLGTIILIVGVFFVCYFVWKKFVKPYQFQSDSTICFSGGLGSGKSLNSVKYGIRCFKSVHRKWAFYVLLDRFFPRKKKGPRAGEEPRFVSNIPVRWLSFKGFRPHWQYCNVLTSKMLLLKERIPVGSVVLLDESPQFVNQFQFDNKMVQNELNEFITFFRHYVQGVFILNAQSIEEVEVHIRRKLSTYYRCFDFHRILWVFYSCKVLRCAVGDMSVSLTKDFIDENAQKHYGILLPFLRHYDSHCYSGRYDKVQSNGYLVWKRLKTNKVIRLDEKVRSELDD